MLDTLQKNLPTLFNQRNNLIKQELLSSIYRWGTRGLDKLNNPPKITQAIHEEAGIHTLGFWLENPCFQSLDYTISALIMSAQTPIR